MQVATLLMERVDISLRHDGKHVYLVDFAYPVNNMGNTGQDTVNMTIMMYLKNTGETMNNDNIVTTLLIL